MFCMTLARKRVAKKKAKERNLQIDEEIRNRRKNQLHDMLILGAPQSGKSTLLKQIKLLTVGFSQHERVEWILDCRVDVLRSLQHLFVISHKLDISFSSDVIDSFDNLSRLTDEELTEERMTNEHRNTIIKLCENPEIMGLVTMWREHELNESGLSDSLHYLLTHASRIFSKEFIPNDADILRTKRRKSVVQEVCFDQGKRTMRAIDLENITGNKKKWTDQFDSVDYVIYCISLSDFNMTLAESPDVNKLRESLEEFRKEISQTNEQRVEFVVLNKMDLFREKLEKYHFSSFISEYQGPNIAEDCAKFIEEKLRQIMADTYVTVRCTSALDQEDFKLAMTLISESYVNCHLMPL
eukprot:TRINITY_DN6248_c0_g1_i1.p1 TRINITY_DN6248_c0_g1~~TRINITY_DN6248_c0_g1_i1.p1  ORF type:complete len:354 (-),score=70.57 TRINITY_DN6248_c0_g1_i1:302-1363(-)